VRDYLNNPNKFGQSGKTECPAKLFALTALLTIIVNTLPKRWMIPNIEKNRGKINQAFTKTVIQAWNPTISLIEIRRLKMKIFQGQSREWTI